MLENTEITGFFFNQKKENGEAPVPRRSSEIMRILLWNNFPDWTQQHSELKPNSTLSAQNLSLRFWIYWRPTRRITRVGKKVHTNLSQWGEMGNYHLLTKGKSLSAPFSTSTKHFGERQTMVAREEGWKGMISARKSSQLDFLLHFSCSSHHCCF